MREAIYAKLEAQMLDNKMNHGYRHVYSTTFRDPSCVLDANEKQGLNAHMIKNFPNRYGLYVPTSTKFEPQSQH